MKLSRRQFAALTAAVAAGVGTRCIFAASGSAQTLAGPEKEPADSPPTKGEILDAGVLGDYPADDVYDKFRGDGFFIIRRSNQITALSSICTHKGCKLRVADDLSFFCKCHGSTFDKNGQVTKGPAKRDLPFLAVAVDKQSHVWVDPNRHVTPSMPAT